jgi:hypothetical protein
VRYIDSGKRESDQALGSWLAELAQDVSIIELRWQTGFFSVDGIGHIAPLISGLSTENRVVRLLLGSNDGVTRRADIEILFNVAGPPRDGLNIGVISFENCYYHPKVVHFKRDDGSMAAYVGSANLTRSGVSALHVEAGIVMDTRDGDDAAVLSSIADAVDWWFEGSHDGLFRVSGPDDLNSLVASKVLGMARPPSPRATNFEGKVASTLPRLAPLINIPPITLGSKPTKTPKGDEPTYTVVVVEEEWSKRLSASDAQRKASGNQRGSITLVKGRYSIDAQTYFRHVFFADAPWIEEETRTGENIESALVSMLVDINGINIGPQDIKITHGASREASQGNYTTLIHLGPLAPYFASQNMTGRRLSIARRNDETFSLSVE